MLEEHLFNQNKLRDLAVKMKHNVQSKSSIEGKSIILIDDSIVRGTTSKKIVKIFKKCWSKEVHLRIACPELKFPDFYGVDMPKKKN